MKIHEYQAKEIFRRFGVPTPRGEMVTTAEDARKVAQKLGVPVVVVKAQIHAGGRGKGGGVKLARSVDEAGQLASKILGMTLVTPQTGPLGVRHRSHRPVEPGDGDSPVGAVQRGEVRAHGKRVDPVHGGLARGRLAELALPEVGETVEVLPVGEDRAR